MRVLKPDDHVTGERPATKNNMPPIVVIKGTERHNLSKYILISFYHGLLFITACICPANIDFVVSSALSIVKFDPSGPPLVI